MEKLQELFTDRVNNTLWATKKHFYDKFEVEQNLNRLDMLKLFVQFLVKNDKIDFDKLKPLTWVTEIMLATNYPNWIKAKRRYRLYEQLLMLLSIQDDPIKFLVSILK